MLYFNSAWASSQHPIMSLHMRATRDNIVWQVCLQYKSTLFKYESFTSINGCVFLFSSSTPFPSLQMNLKPFWSACPLITSWTCPSLPSSGQLTCPSRSGTRSWSPAPLWSWEKPRRLSGNCSPWANAALNNPTLVYPEKGNPETSKCGIRCSFLCWVMMAFGSQTARDKQSKLANLHLFLEIAHSKIKPHKVVHKWRWERQLKHGAEFCSCCFCFHLQHFPTRPCTFCR